MAVELIFRTVLHLMYPDACDSIFVMKVRASSSKGLMNVVTLKNVQKVTRFQKAQQSFEISKLRFNTCKKELGNLCRLETN
jgi:hypothetical protein